MYRTALATTNSRVLLATTSRTFHSTALAAKTAKEKVTEVADKVNKKVGLGLAHAIEKGEEVTEKTKETFGTASTHAKQNAAEAGQKVNQAAAGARQGKEDFKADVQKEVRK